MTTLNAYEGANAKLYFVKEITRGVVPENPVLTELKSTGGMPIVNMDALESAVIGAGREVSDIDLGNVNVTATINCELAYGAQDDLIAGALSSSWVAGSTVAGLNITVDAAGNKYTRDSGDFVADGFAVGDYVQFPSLTEGSNSLPRFITAVTALDITVGSVKEFKPMVDETGTTDAIKGDSLSVGDECNHMTVIAEFKGKCNAPDVFIVTTGIEIAGGSINADISAKVTAEFPMIGYDQYVADSLPVGATVAPLNANYSYSGLDSSISFDDTIVSAITSFGYSTEDSAAAQFVLNSELAGFVSRNRIKNTVTASSFVENFDLLASYRNKKLLRMEMSLHREKIGGMAFVTKQTMLTEVTHERSENPVTANITAMAIGDADNSSIIVYRIPEA